MGIWTIDETTYANHKITIIYETWNNLLQAKIKGPRSGSTNNNRFANDVEWKLSSKIPFKSPSVKKIKNNKWPIEKEARKRIDNAIAAHAKKYEEDYQ